MKNTCLILKHPQGLGTKNSGRRHYLDNNLLTLWDNTDHQIDNELDVRLPSFVSFPSSHIILWTNAGVMRLEAAQRVLFGSSV
jgi:membrane-associated phospholipid phosphatase